jgi:hypothetical protein
MRPVSATRVPRPILREKRAAGAAAARRTSGLRHNQAQRRERGAYHSQPMQEPPR